ncbi:MAG: cob(I)yrinic acid a,c-diamide adenosyltransferase [Acidimicrobiales bacterium]|jgi:cob(I)alamin adenosyltransferase|nr:cob(I)yrinic acid a,c-diamide adenosyltransferase [Acidimicrobiales bacterium]
MTEVRVYTRRGDDGTTGLLYGSRVAKDAAQPRAYGDVDETQAAIGLARAAAGPELGAILVGLERDLWMVMAELACNPEKVDQLHESGSRPTPEMVTALESLIDDVSDQFESPTEFVVPGEDEVSARLDVARTVCRRAERSALSAAAEGSSVLPYLNRLSDLLWTLARWQEGGSLATRSVPRSAAFD